MKRFLFLIAAVLTAVSGWAQGVSADEALAKAKAFMSERQSVDGTQNSRIMGNKLFQRVNSNNEYYIFNVGAGDGFVIVSGDERTDDILGFCDKGAIDMDNMPENMRWWLDMYREEINQLQQSASTPLRAAIPSLSAVSPMLTTKWNQNNPYNAYLPEYTEGKKSATGCVATALAQILYHVRPNTVGVIPSYTTKKHQISLDALPQWIPDWGAIDGGNMDEVAKLMLYCGQSIMMNYGSSSSASTQHVPASMRRFFSLDCQRHRRAAYSSSDWISLLHNELSNNTPVLLGGQSETAGHAFVCDGYDGNGLFHINWGWGGTSDGYFKMDNLTPKTQGTGGSSGGYSSDVDAVTGFTQTTDNYPNLLTCLDIINDEETSSYDGNSVTFDLTARLFNFAPYDNDTYDYSFALFDENDNMVILSSGKPGSGHWDLNYGIKITRSPVFNGIEKDKKYKLYPIFRVNGETDWHKFSCVNDVHINVDAKADKVYLSSNNSLLNISANYTISNIEIIGDVYASTSYKNKMNITVTNNGTTNECKFLVVENNTITSSFPVLLDPGETATIPVDFICQQTGEHDIYIYQEFNSSQQVLKPVTVNAKSMNYAVLTMTKPTLKSDKGGELTVTYTLQNNTSSDYEAPIEIKLYANTTGNYYSSAQTVSNIVSLSHNSTKTTYTYTFTGLAENRYFVRVYYYKQSASSAYSESSVCSVDATPTAIESVKTDASTSLRIYTIDGRRVNPDSMKKGIYIINGKKVVNN